MLTNLLWSNRVRIIGFCLLAGLVGYPQSSLTQTAPPVRRTPIASPRRTPCWQQVGIAKTAIEQRREIERNSRSQVESVCADSNLTVRQKRQKVKEIRQQAREQIDTIITPQQQQELKACNAERAGNRPVPPRRPVGKGLGPCSETATTAPAPEGEPPDEASKQP